MSRLLCKKPKNDLDHFIDLASTMTRIPQLYKPIVFNVKPWYSNQEINEILIPSFNKMYEKSLDMMMDFYKFYNYKGDFIKKSKEIKIYKERMMNNTYYVRSVIKRFLTSTIPNMVLLNNNENLVIDEEHGNLATDIWEIINRYSSIIQDMNILTHALKMYNLQNVECISVASHRSKAKLPSEILRKLETFL